MTTRRQFRKIGRRGTLIAAVLVALVAFIGIRSADVFGASGAPNSPPAANVTAVPTSGSAPLTVTIDGSMSSDPNGTIASWTLAYGDGSPAATGTGVPPSPTEQHTYANPGVYSEVLTLTDASGQTGTSIATVTVLAAQSSPVPRLSESVGSGAAPLDVSSTARRARTPVRRSRRGALDSGTGARPPRDRVFLPWPGRPTCTRAPGPTPPPFR